MAARGSVAVDDVSRGRTEYVDAGGNAQVARVPPAISDHPAARVQQGGHGRRRFCGRFSGIAVFFGIWRSWHLAERVSASCSALWQQYQWLCWHIVAYTAGYPRVYPRRIPLHATWGRRSTGQLVASPATRHASCRGRGEALAAFVCSPSVPSDNRPRPSGVALAGLTGGGEG